MERRNFVLWTTTFQVTEILDVTELLFNSNTNIHDAHILSWKNSIKKKNLEQANKNLFINKTF